jgi:hypothetical protein
MSGRSFLLPIALGAILLGCFLLGGWLLGSFLAASTGSASAARLPLSTITVNVLSVDRESFHRDERRPPAQSDVVFDTTRFVARALITEVLKTDHGLNPGALIDIRYDVTERQPPHPAFPVRARLNAGETATLTVFGGGSSFIWRN